MAPSNNELSMTNALFVINPKATHQEMVGLRVFSFRFNQTNFAVMSFVKERPYGLACHSLAVILEVTGGRNGTAQTDHGGCIQGGKMCQKRNKSCTRVLNASLYNLHISRIISHIHPKLALIIHSWFMVSLLSFYYKSPISVPYINYKLHGLLFL